MQQIPLPIGFDNLPTFESFVAGSNTLALTHLQQGSTLTAPVYLWGVSGSGKTHLLRATTQRLQNQGGQVRWFAPDHSLPWDFDESVAMAVFDDCDRLSESEQQAAMAFFVQASAHGIPILAAARVPPVDLTLREDLRTRFGWGHVFALQPLSEMEIRGALRYAADRRGLFLSDDVLHHLLTRFERNLKSLMGLLDRLDTYSLTHQRPITIALIKKMLAELT